MHWNERTDQWRWRHGDGMMTRWLCFCFVANLPGNDKTLPARTPDKSFNGTPLAKTSPIQMKWWVWLVIIFASQQLTNGNALDETKMPQKNWDATSNHHTPGHLLISNSPYCSINSQARVLPMMAFHSDSVQILAIVHECLVKCILLGLGLHDCGLHTAIYIYLCNTDGS